MAEVVGEGEEYALAQLSVGDMETLAAGEGHMAARGVITKIRYAVTGSHYPAVQREIHRYSGCETEQVQTFVGESPIVNSAADDFMVADKLISQRIVKRTGHAPAGSDCSQRRRKCP